MRIYLKVDESQVITSYGFSLNDKHIPFDDGVELIAKNNIDLDTICFNYKYIENELVELTNDEKEFYKPIPKPTLKEVVEEQANKITILTDGLKSVLKGDVQELAYLLYPEDFTK